MSVVLGAVCLPPRPVPPQSIACFARSPAIVAMWYARSKKYGEKNVMYDSYAWYNHMLSDSSQMKNMPEVRRTRRPATPLEPCFGGLGM